MVRVIFNKKISWGERRCDFTLIGTLPSLSSLPVPRSIPVSLSSSPSHRLYIRIRFIGIFIRIYFKWKSKLESNNFILIIILSLHLFFPSYSLYFYLISNPIDYPLRSIPQCKNWGRKFKPNKLVLTSIPPVHFTHHCSSLDGSIPFHCLQSHTNSILTILPYHLTFSLLSPIRIVPTDII